MTRKRGESRSQEKALGKIRAGHSTGGCFPGYRSYQLEWAVPQVTKVQPSSHGIITIVGRFKSLVLRNMALSIQS